MTHQNLTRRLLWVGVIATATMAGPGAAQTLREQKGPQPPSVGTSARNFVLRNVEGERVELRHLTHYGPVTLVFLCGYHDRQSALCRSQFRRYLAEADRFADRQSSVVFVYPGRDRDLAEHAKEFVGRAKMPEDFYLVVDSGVRLTKAYGLEWKALRETGYPCTIVVDRKGDIRFVQSSRHHGGRTAPNDILPVLDEVLVASDRDERNVRRR